LSKIFFKKGNFNIKISQEKKIPKKNPEFSKNWKKKFTLRKEKKNSVEFALIFFSKTFANLFVQAKNDKISPKIKIKIHCKLSCRQKRVESVTILPSWASMKFF
jgi:hypothetical protein